jgi:hypothetical protein
MPIPIPRLALLRIALRCVAALRLRLSPTNYAHAETLMLMLTPLAMPVAEPKTLKINPVPLLAASPHT